jgi:hypothetical protein
MQTKSIARTLSACTRKTWLDLNLPLTERGFNIAEILASTIPFFTTDVMAQVKGCLRFAIMIAN